MKNINEEDKHQQNIDKDSKIIEVPEEVKNSNKDKQKKKDGNKRNEQKNKYSSDTSVSNLSKGIENDIINKKEEATESTFLKKDTNKNEFNNDKIMAYHCLPLTFVSQKKVYVLHNFKRGIIDLVIFHVSLFMYLINYILSIVVLPGYIPNTDEWALKNFPENYVSETENSLLEKKKTGERRYCKWCSKYKPDRTHHCRVCKTCVLKMDHHCPWIYNCVGYKNHKYFMLSLIYCCITTIFVSITMYPTVRDAINHYETPFNELFLLLFGEMLNTLLAIIITCFLFFHIWLIARGMTTIEFCEKRTNYHNQTYTKYYNKGLWGNFKDTFGESAFFWFLPIDNRKGDGINFKKVHKDENSAISEEETVAIKYDH
ncbi:palmitoyltransferase [Hepatocystis sp. ex Piliocolobus tephrosceles]|nr:palmitoyltransferase [Hepatocystis sp. ex Piliocolobus tephrosceles]